MKNYSKIVGVLITVTLLACLFVLTNIIFDNTIDSEEVVIVFEDEDGFNLRSIIIDNFTNRINDEGVVYGKYKNSDLYMSYDEYSNFSSWSLHRY